MILRTFGPKRAVGRTRGNRKLQTRNFVGYSRLFSQYCLRDYVNKDRGDGPIITHWISYAYRFLV